MDWVVPLTLLTETFSMPVSVKPAVVPATLPVTETLKVSVPAPPLSTSPAANVVPVELAAAVLTITPLNVSAPVLPVKLVPESTPVVSDLSHALDKSLILNSLLRILDDLFLITYDAPTVTKIIAKLKVPKAEVLSGLS